MSKRKRQSKARSQPKLSRNARLAPAVAHIALLEVECSVFQRVVIGTGRGNVLRVTGVRRKDLDYEKLAQAYLELLLHEQAATRGQPTPPPRMTRDEHAVETHRRRKATRKPKRKRELDRRLKELKERHQRELDELLGVDSPPG